MNDFEWGMKAHNAVNEMDRDIPGLSGPTITFMTGAEWQREQLRTPEAIEIMAIAIYEGETERPWDTASKWVQDDCRMWARRSINAVLGED